MSSHTYSTDLTPDSALRQIIVIVGLAVTVLGIVMIALLPVATPWRALGGVVWLTISTRDLFVIKKGHKRCQRLRIVHDGSIEVLAPDGCWFPATLLAGSVVLSRVAWLRFECDDGQRCAELMRGKCLRNKHWRRLQVIWRHLGAGA